MKIKQIKELIKKLTDDLEQEEKKTVINVKRVTYLNYQIAVAQNGLRHYKKYA